METLEDLKNYLIVEAEYNQEHVDTMSPYNLVKAFLEWNGIYGYQDDVIDVVRIAYNLNFEK